MSAFKANEKLKDFICNYILPNELYKGGYDIRIADDNKFKINYKNHNYYAEIIEEKDGLYWKVNPYKNSYFTTKINSYSSFDVVLFAIKEADEMRKK